MNRFILLFVFALALFNVSFVPMQVHAQFGGGGGQGGDLGGGGQGGGLGGGGQGGGLGGGGVGTSTGSTSVGGPLTNPLNGISDLPSLLNAILGAVVKLGAIFLTLMLVYVGFKFVAAQGNAEELKSARTMLVWTVIGGLILLGATAISAVIQSTVGSLM